MDLYCNICKCYVQENTKHCGPCNRCCERFDHHCNWLNNCIGQANYKTFFKLILAFFLYNICSILMFVQALGLSLLGTDKIGMPLLITLWVLEGINVVACLALAHLINFHRWLSNYSMTTFSYVMYKRRLKEKETEVKVSYHPTSSSFPPSRAKLGKPFSNLQTRQNSVPNNLTSFFTYYCRTVTSLRMRLNSGKLSSL